MGCKTRYQESLVELKIDKGWEFQNTKNESVWHKARVPGDIISELASLKGFESRWFISHQQINEILGSSWEYRTSFDVTEHIFLKESITLSLPGIRGSIDVFINNKLADSGVSKEGVLNIAVKGLLKEGTNILSIIFKPSSLKDINAGSIEGEDIGVELGKADISYLIQKLDKLPFNEVHTLPGLSEAPYLTAWSNAMIEQVYFYPLTISEKNAQYNAEIDITASCETEMNLEISVDNKSIIKLHELKLKPGNNKQMISFNIPNPKLWWINGLGSQSLYNLTFRLFKSKQLVHEVSYPMGVRKLDVIFEQDSINKPLSFILNGQPVSLKGGTIDIPANIDPASVESFYKRIVENAKAANVNIIRVLHTDFYQPDLFYKLCSTNGILVWQDFIVSEPKNYSNPNDHKYSVERTVKSLRNLPCVAVYMGKPQGCGESNSNMNDITRTKGISAFLTNKNVPVSIKKYDHRTFYWSIMNSDDRQNRSSLPGSSSLCSIHGDEWHAFNSSNSFKYIARQINISAHTMDTMLHSSGDISKLVVSDPNIASYLDRLVQSSPTPSTVGAALYYSQLYQADKIKKFIEDYRLNNTNYWDFINLPLFDNQPSGTGTFIDFWGYSKASHYSLKNAYAGVVLITQEEGLRVNIFAINNELKDLEAILLCKMIDFSGNGYFVKQVPVKIKANSKVLLLTLNKNKLLNDLATSSVALLLQLNQPGRTYAQNLYYFEDYRQLNLTKANIKVDINESTQGFNIILKSDVLAKNVFLETNRPDTRFSDNNIDMLPGKRYKITVVYNGSRRELSENLVITSINNLR